MALVTLAALIAAVAASGASAEASLGGSAAGVTIPAGGGVYRIVGTFAGLGSSAVGGRYQGTLYNSGDYMSCLGGSILGCLYDPTTGTFYGNCNLVSGSLTLYTPEGSVTLLIGADPSTFFRSSICQRPGDPGTHDVFLRLFNASPPSFSTGFGDVADAIGTFDGVSRPLGSSSVYGDTLQLSVALFPPLT
jgi:hypothetical protein